MQHVLLALQYRKSSSYSIFICVISLFGRPPPWMPGVVAPFVPPSARHCSHTSTSTLSCIVIPRESKFAHRATARGACDFHCNSRHQAGGRNPSATQV